MNYTSEIRELIEHLLDPDNSYNQNILYQRLLEFKEKESPQRAEMIENIVNDFFSRNIYYYIQTKDIYIEYVEHHFKVISENELLHHILHELTPYGLNTSLKQLIKCKIHKRIKETSIYSNIPDSDTIQNVLSHLSPNIFIKKNYAKYFLITLGDIIQHKTEQFYFLSINMKSFVQMINKYTSQYIHSINLFNHYKFKYYDHDIDKSRILKTTQLNMEYFKPDDTFYMDLICCALHYSRRYESGDKFIEDITNEDIRGDIMWIKTTNKYEIVDKFISEYTYIKEGTNINEKDMMFLWRLFLKQNNIMNLFQKNLDVQNYISTKVTYLSPHFINCNSRFLPYVEQFNEFWNKYIYMDDSEYPFELNDILRIFMETYKYKKNMDIQIIIDLIQYYYPNIQIVEGKYVLHIGCVLWNKKKEIDTFLLHQESNDINELYRIYSEGSKSGRNISKQYFVDYYKELQSIS
jgi:hypothetical protein